MRTRKKCKNPLYLPVRVPQIKLFTKLFRFKKTTFAGPPGKDYNKPARGYKLTFV